MNLVRFKTLMLNYFHSSNLFLWNIFIFFLSEPALGNPCIPNPCGSNSICKDNKGVASCSCIPNYIGTPPDCRPECTVNSECERSKSCINQRCVDPCIGVCGQNAECRVINHAPVCSCRENFDGDPFTRCAIRESKYFIFKYITLNLS